MAIQNEIPDLGAGEIIKSKPYCTDVFEVFDDGVIAGVFVAMKTNDIADINGDSFGQKISNVSAVDDRIAGVASRKITGMMEQTDLYHTDFDNVCEVHNYGYATVRMLNGEHDLPQRGDQVYASISPTQAGRGCTTDVSSVLVDGCVFWEKKKEDVWLVRMGNALPVVVEAEEPAPAGE